MGVCKRRAVPGHPSAAWGATCPPAAGSPWARPAPPHETPAGQARPIACSTWPPSSRTPAAAHAQLLAPSPTKYAPCDGGKEATCASTGAAAGKPICCERHKAVCGTRLDGAPRCVTCPQYCPVDCMPGYKCGADPADPNRCWKCLPDPGGSATPGYVRTTCSASKPCPTGQLCSTGFCRQDPCTDPGFKGCSGATPKCSVTPSFTAECIAGARLAWPWRRHVLTASSLCALLGSQPIRPALSGACRRAAPGAHPSHSSSLPPFCCADPATAVATGSMSSNCKPACGKGYQCSKVGSKLQCVKLQVKKRGRRLLAAPSRRELRL